MKESHKAWADQEHAVHFDGRSCLPGFLLQRAYERFNEIRLLNDALDGRTRPCRLLEVGCATGELFRYLRLRHPGVEYTGCDISRPALERARQKYPAQDRFIETDVGLKAVSHLAPDVVFCRDVAHHQPDPIAFIARLYTITGWLLVLRVRTRDIGATVADPAESCQLNYGEWAPYIVLNSRELIDKVRQFTPPPARVHLVKHHMILGGQHARFLPKDCYLLETGTAESALVIEKGTGRSSSVFREESAPEYLTPGLAEKVLLRVFRR